MKQLLKLLSLCLCTSLTAQLCLASVPGFVNYQGRLLDDTGTVFADGTYDAAFRIYDAELSGNLIWSEYQQITVKDGSFSVALGEGTTINGDSPAVADITDAFTGTERYLGVTVDSAPGANGSLDVSSQEFAPRQQFLSNTFSFQAANADQVVNSKVELKTSVSNTGELILKNASGDARLTLNVDANGAADSNWSNSTGTEVVDIRANHDDSGYIELKGTNGVVNAVLGGFGASGSPADRNSGTMNLYDDSGNLRFNAYSDPNFGGGGAANWVNTSNNAVVSIHSFYAGENGFISVKDSTPQDRIILFGDTGTTETRGANGSINTTVGSHLDGNLGYIVVYGGGGNWKARMFADGAGHGYIDVFNAAGGSTIALNGGSGNVFCTSLTQSSDERFKKNIQPLKDVLSKVLAVKGFSFDWKEEGKNGEHSSIGFMAQQMETVFPELVHTNEDGYKSISYTNMSAILVEAVKEQQSVIDAQNERISHLEAQLKKVLNHISQ